MDRQPVRSIFWIKLHWIDDLGYHWFYYRSHLLGCDSAVLLPVGEAAQQK